MPHRSPRRLHLLLLLGLGVGACAAPATTRRSASSETAVPEEVVEATREAAQVAFARGSYLREIGAANEALAALREAVFLWPENASLRLALARQYLDMGRYQEADHLLGDAALAGTAGPAEFLLLARLRAVAGKPEEALQHVDSALAADSTLVAGWLLRGRLASDLHRRSEALASFERANALQPDQAATLLQLGKVEEELGKLPEAESRYRRALELEPQLGAARSALVELLEKNDRLAEAIAVQQDALALVPEDRDALEWLVQLYLREKRYPDVVALLQPRDERHELEPRHEYILGWALLQSEQYDSAEKLLTRLAEGNEFPGAEHLLGELALRQDRSEAAEKHFRAAIRLQPDACAAHLGLATVLLERLRDAAGRVQRQGPAADSLRAVLATASAHTSADEVRCNVLLGYAYLQLREFDAAVRHLEAGHRLDPDNTDVLFNLAMAHQELGHYETALTCGRDVLQRQPENAAALNFVGYIQAERGLALEESETLVRRAIAAEPDNGFYVDSLGWVLFQRGHFAGAVVELERAADLTKHQDAVILEHLGDAYRKAGRPQEALRVYGRSRELAPENGGLRDKIDAVQAEIEKP